MTESPGLYPHFRLNFEQQGKRAKELLKAARAGEPAALARFNSSPRLAEAQYLIAQELRFRNWAALKHHIAAITREREAALAQAVWSEFDTYDQLVLVRVLGHYATHRRPGCLELINTGEFP